MNNKPLPKTAIRILGRPGIDSLTPPGDGIGDIYWSCWSSKGWSAPNGSDGIRETSLGSIESWAKILRGPTDPDRVPPVAEVMRKHIETGVITDTDLRSLSGFIERGMEQRFGWVSQRESSRMDSIDRYEFDESLAKRYKISIKRLDAFSLAIAIADEATDSNQYRNFLRKHQRWEQEGEAKAEALLASEAAT